MSEPLVEAWRRWSDRFMDPKNRDGTPIRDAFAAGWDAARAEPGASLRTDSDEAQRDVAWYRQDEPGHRESVRVLGAIIERIRDAL